MPTRIRRRSRFAFLVLPAICVAIAGYFGWQSTRGDFSSEARAALAAERAERAAVLQMLQAEREQLLARVKRFRADQYDADLLDERARAQLFVAHPGEIVVFHDVTPRPETDVILIGTHGSRGTAAR